jgi:hypothetical protein
MQTANVHHADIRQGLSVICSEMTEMSIVVRTSKIQLYPSVLPETHHWTAVPKTTSLCLVEVTRIGMVHRPNSDIETSRRAWRIMSMVASPSRSSPGRLPQTLTFTVACIHAFARIDVVRVRSCSDCYARLSMLLVVFALASISGATLVRYLWYPQGLDTFRTLRKSRAESQA